MTVEVNSIERAVWAARFLARYLGPKVTAIRCRMVNRFFAAEEGSPSDLVKTLDENVTVIDPRKAEANLRRECRELRKNLDPERAAAAFLRRKLVGREDVPMVEDFPLAPEEETPEFTHLATALNFRFIRAAEHWQGKTHLTLTAIILRMVEGAFPNGLVMPG